MRKFHIPVKFSKYNLILRTSQEIIIFFDRQGKVFDCSDAAREVLGYGRDIYQITIDKIFKNIFSFSENKLQVEAKYKKSIQEAVAYRKNMTCFPVNLRVSVIESDLKYIGICTAVNITEKREAAQELNIMKDELSNFNQISSELVARIAHELRTPINGILGFCNNLLDMELNSEQKEAMDIIKKCCSGMNTIVNDLLDFAKLTNNKLVLEKREFNFNNFIKHIVDLNTIHVNEKGLKLLLDIADDIPDRVIGDELRLAQILNNLISNAIKFTPSGQISLEVVKQQQTARFVELFFMVNDTGIGISREEKEKLFKSFSQVDSSITRRFGGTGLGLSISKKLVEAMHGTIDVESEKNKGSTFTFSVRLRLPDSSYSEENEISEWDNYDNTDFEKDGFDVAEETEKNKTDVSGVEYINNRLKGIVPKFDEENSNLMDIYIAEIGDLLDKIAICLEMENWEKAEELADRIKCLIPKSHYINSKNILRLLMAIRKEDHDLALTLLEECKMNMLINYK
jgi:PAS domain S-box